ncbi:hypothetical protein L596_002367 [Steinernema carpocapsae]|uniref:glutathione transferase n=1 Tax=Steinernema carpocapsae TaxID=34508 RepID=A0A4U8UNZ1_STECR|nr:hypothetical protein L596_002367 [Steinernema carpocapsae]
MPTFKLTYFDGRGLGEPARMLFAFNKIPFEDIRIKKEEWLALKPKTPYGQLPVLEVDGKELAQSFAIYRYLANEFGLAGNTPLEKAQVDAVADAYKDFSDAIKDFMYVCFGMREGDVNTLYKEVVVPAMAKHFPNILKVLKCSPSGFLMKGGITWADIYITCHLYTLQQHKPEALNDYLDLETLIEKVVNHPNLAKHVFERPESIF